MRSSSRTLLGVAVAAIVAAAAEAARIDMEDPRRAVGRENNIRVDAQMLQEALSPGASISITYRVQNLSDRPVAIAEKVSSLSYDPDTQTITLSVGAEVPGEGPMPQMLVINPGEMKTRSTGGIVHIAVPSVRSPLAATPRYFQIRVNVIRDVAPFSDLIRAQGSGRAVVLTDGQFEAWLDVNESIFLNVLPIRWSARNRAAVASAEERLPTGW